MSILIFVDTNVYLDYFLGRRSGLIPLDEFAAQVFNRTLACEFDILVSDLVLSELEGHGVHESMQGLLHRLREKNKLVEIKSTHEDHAIARTLATHKADALHIALALRGGATYIVTNNLRDFFNVQARIAYVSPRFL